MSNPPSREWRWNGDKILEIRSAIKAWIYILPKMEAGLSIRAKRSDSSSTLEKMQALQFLNEQ